MTLPATPIEFWFDFSSPYGYLAAQRIDDVAAANGSTVAWRPFLLGALFKLTGSSPLLDQPLKGDYARHDMARSARRTGVPFRLPDPFPFSGVAASRAFYWLDGSDPSAAVAFAKRAYAAIFGAGRDLSKPPAVVDVLADCGHDRAAAEAGIADPAVKERLRAAVDSAIERKIFGSPYFLVGDDPFWGVDRLPDLAAWIEQGGW
ncbi:MAG: 2-hydroxychromene-2-carboxylate isomerase [Alphaproteobacteria bacterium]